MRPSIPRRRAIGYATALVATVLAASFAGGVLARGYRADPATPAHDRFPALVLELIGELARETHVVSPSLDRPGFVRAHEQELRECNDRAQQARRDAHRTMRILFEENYEREELAAFFVQDPRQAELPVWIVLGGDGDRFVVPIDAADWPDYYPRTRFGLGPRNALKSRIYDLLTGGPSLPEAGTESQGQ